MLTSDNERHEKLGSSPENPIVVKSVPQEYEWVAANLPGFVLTKQNLRYVDERPFDVFVVRNTEGVQREVYFDIQSFFGREKAAGGPCPHCGVPLRTSKAQQCRQCGMDWHDPENVVCRK